MAEVLARTVLWYIVFTGFAVNYMIRINANIAIVSMIVPAVCRRNRNLTCADVLNATAPGVTRPRIGSFYWNEYEQSLVLGSFFWLHWCTQLPGGILARKYGGKLVFGLSNLGMGLMSLLIPWVSHWDYKSLIVLRVLQGISGGFAWPAMHHLTAHWIPPNERGKFVSAYLGSSIGAALTYPICGVINDILGWEYVYYITGAIVILWFIIWMCIVYDTPAQHPRISPQEKHYIETCLGQSVTKKKFPVPWRKILTSVPVHMNVIQQIGGVWSLFTLLTQAPTYFRFIHGWNNKMTGVLSGLPHLLRFLFSLGFGIFADRLLKRKTLSQTNVRKLASAFCTLVQGIFVLGLAFSGYNSAAAIFNLAMATMVHGAVTAGPLASLVELSPNFAGVLQGISGMLSSIPSFISPVLVGIYTNNNQTPEQWTKVFLITAALLFIPGVLNLFFGDSELQPWNDPSEYNLVKSNNNKKPKTKLKPNSINDDSS
ncbi:hypothetical protein M8J76_001052 [Diaphorina citri]|nr:hypothetical protein M8J76_001052 [Diaphorina citri]